jgi:hypothetical protein
MSTYAATSANIFYNDEGRGKWYNSSIQIDIFIIGINSSQIM